MARPLIEFFSVEIFPKSLPCQVYGDIIVHDEADSEETYTLYERDSENPEAISDEGHLLPITSSDVPLSMRSPVITVQLKKAPDEAAIVSCRKLLDITVPIYDQDKCCECRGEHGYVRVNYIAMKFGVVIELSLFLKTSNPDVAQKLKESNKYFPVFGSIVARYGKTYGHTTCDSSLRYFSVLKIPHNKYTALCSSSNNGEVDSLLLNRELLAVPAYSSLTIEVDLKESYTNQQFLCGEICRRASTGSPHLNGPKCLPSLKSDKAWLRCRKLEPVVDFGSPYSSLIEDKLDSMSLDIKEKLTGWSYRQSILEVYSVLIGREKQVDLSISGEIRILHSNSARVLVSIFKRDDNDAEELVNGEELLSITGPSRPSEFLGSEYYFNLEMMLKDANHHFSISLGNIIYDTMLERDLYKQDMLLCSVIEGERGFCAVHYTIFSTAVGIEVKCAVLGKGFDVGNVYGKVVASYDMFDYSSFNDDSRYYAKILFNKSEKDSVDFLRKVAHKKARESMADGRNPIAEEFSTSYIAMPVGGYTLFLNVDMHASSRPGRRGSPLKQRFKDMLQFKLGDDSPMKIIGEHFDFLVHVKMISASSCQG